MDPWADDGNSVNDAGPSWSPTANKTTSSPSFTPARYQEPTSTVDPWASERAVEDIHPMPTPESEQRSSEVEAEDHTIGGSGEESLGSKDFDPWGGGAPPSMPLGGGLGGGGEKGFSLNTQTGSSSAHAGSRNEIENESDSGWQPEHSYGEESRITSVATKDPSDDDLDDEETQQHTIVDEDDPWGSGAQAMRLKDESEAQAAAQRMEILRLQQEAKGEVEDNKEEADTAANLGRSHETQEKSTRQPKEGANHDDIKPETNTAAASTGWRSFFSRGTKASVDPKDEKDVDNADQNTPRQSTEIKDSPRTSMSTAAPRLWQAPTLRMGHERTPSNASQGSTGKPSSATIEAAPRMSSDTKGPGWEITTKKQTGAGSGGFISNFLGHGQSKDSSSGSALARFGQSLQRPPVVSASDPDPDDSGEMEGTGIEWEAGDTFDINAKQKKRQEQEKPAVDLLSGEQVPQESAVSRMIGRWRGKQAPENVKGKDGMTGDDLSWLESMGGNGNPPQTSVDRGQSTATSTSDDDWLAFVEDRQQTPSVQANTSRSAIPKVDGPIKIPLTNKQRPIVKQTNSGTLHPPPRLAAPPQRGQPNVSGAQDVSPEMDDSFGRFVDEEGKRQTSDSSAYRDEPDSYDNSLLQKGPAQQRGPQGQTRQHSSNFLASLAGRPMKAYTFDDDDDEHQDAGMHNDSWTAFKDVPNDEEVNFGKNLSTNNRGTGQPPRQESTDRQKYGQMSSHQMPVRSSLQTNVNRQKDGSAGAASAAFLPPPPSSSRSQNVAFVGGGHAQQANTQQTNAAGGRSNLPPSPSISAAPTKTVKALSHGQQLTNDDLSFFENL